MRTFNDPCAVGIDLGTSGVKAVLIDAAGTLLAQSHVALDVQRTQALWSEQHPADWWVACDHAIRLLREQSASHPGAWQGVKGLTVAGQMHGAVLLDAQNQVVRPAILWNDGRAQFQCAELESREPRTRAITQNRVMAGFTAPKLLWVAKHEPENFERTATVLLPKDWINFQLTGMFSTDCSDASGTLWLDVEKRCWSVEMLAATGLSVSHMPLVHEACDVIGMLLPQWAKRWGLAERVMVAAGAGDNAAGAVGSGMVLSGDAFVSLGTSGVLFTVGHQALPNPECGVHSFCHALPGTWHQMAVHLSAASSLAWWADICGRTPKELLAGMDATTRVAAPLFLPYLSGERTPHSDPSVQAGFIGLTASHTRDDLTYSVLEGVAFAFADGLTALRAAGSDPQRLLAIGGGARSDTWLQLLSNALQLPLDCPMAADIGPALGAARLALLSLNLPRSQVLHRPEISRSFVPHPSAALDDRWLRFRKAYAPLRALVND